MADFSWALKEFGNYLIYVSPGIVGVITGGVLVQWYWVRRANESALIEYLSKELSDLVDETLEYWSLDCFGTSDAAKEHRLLSQKLAPKIKAAIKNLASLLEQYSERYYKKAGFASLMTEVAEACTGGDFDGAKRRADPDRFMRVINTTHRVRWKLFERRV